MKVFKVFVVLYGPTETVSQDAVALKNQIGDTTFLTGSCCTAYSVDVVNSVIWKIKHNNVVYIQIETARSNVCGNKDLNIPFTKGFIFRATFRGRNTTMVTSGFIFVLSEIVVKISTRFDRVTEDYNTKIRLRFD